VAQDFRSPVTYTVTAADASSQAYTVTVTVAANPAKAITAFGFNGLTPNVIGAVNETDKTIALTVPYGTDVTALVPIITHTGANVSPNTGVAQDFRSPVTYTVTAADASSQAYTVTVTVAANPAKEITAFNFDGLIPNVTGTVNEGAKTIALTVPYGTDVDALVPTITHTGASVSPNTGVAQDFRSPVTYTVTAADASSQAYTVTVTVAANPAKAITSFNFNGLTPNVAGTVNETDKTIALTVPYGTDVTALVPTITHTGASVSPNTGVALNFLSPVTYTVTAADASSQAYTVTVIIAAPPSGGGSSNSIRSVQKTVIVIVNGQEQAAGKETNSIEDGKTTIVIGVNNEVIDSKIDEAIKRNTTGTDNVIQVPVTDNKSEAAKVELTGDIVKKLEKNNFDVSMKWDTVEYVIPAVEFTISKAAENLGVKETDLRAIKGRSKNHKIR
jgi:hypothetical protein